MRGRETQSLDQLLELGDGRVLACTAAGDMYYVLEPETEEAERVSVLEASRLWLEGEKKGWNRAPARRAESSESILSMDSKTWREELQRKLGYLRDE